MSATIKVVTFKWSGKYYTEKETELSAEHEAMVGYELSELLDSNHESVHQYSGVSSHFGSPDFYHVVEVKYPDDVQKFCYFLMMKNGQRHGQ